MNRFFTEEHEWIEVNGDIATVGITDYAQEQLGDIVFVELPATGTMLDKGGDAAVVKAHGAAQPLGLVLAFLVQQSRDIPEPRCVAIVGIAVQQRQSQEHPFRMFQPAQVGAGGVVEADRRTIVWMRAPTDVMQQAGGANDALALGRGGFEDRQD